MTATFGVPTADFPDGCAIVFGGSGGLGQAIGSLLAERGADVVVTYRNRPENGEQVAETIRGLGRRARALACDVTDTASVDAVVRDAAAEFGRVHTAVSATGVLFDTGPTVEFTAEQLREVLEADVIGFMNIARAVIPAMRDGGGGSIVAMCTTGVSTLVPHDALSAVPKSAVDRLVKYYANEEARHGIRANALGLGAIDAGMMAAITEANPELVETAVKQWIPLGRLGTAPEVAEAAVFLASAKASYITGSLLLVDGGISVN
ncbi:SDR family NAD(P)-dependent oxidoreductase [Mycolicibacterium thermoresistibile]